MIIDLSVHEVTAIRVGAPAQLSTGQYRTVEVETADGHTFRIAAFSDERHGEATVEVEEQPDVPERHREAG